jgi:ankyrin repeat protein
MIELILKELLNHSKIDVLAKDDNGLIPLHHVCRWKDEKVVAILLSHHPQRYRWSQLNALNHKNQNPLHIACQRNYNYGMVRLLLRHVDVTHRQT